MPLLIIAQFFDFTDEKYMKVLKFCKQNDKLIMNIFDNASVPHHTQLSINMQGF